MSVCDAFSGRTSRSSLRGFLVALAVALPLLAMACLGGSFVPVGMVALDSAYGAPIQQSGSVSRITLPWVKQRDAAEAAHIRSLIQQLAQVEHPDFGFATSCSCIQFAPLISQQTIVPSDETDRYRVECKPFTELVRLGPRALPFLLAALSDKTPTKQRIKPEMNLWMEYADEVPGSTAQTVPHAHEDAVLATLPKPRQALAPSPANYTITVGDVCFTIIGQIVGRDYRFCRGQPTGGVIVNSPTHDPAIARAVRAIWSSNNPSQYLLDTWLRDANSSYLTMPQMLFYFPRETAPQVARLLTRRFDSSASTQSAPASGSGTDDNLLSVAWCQEPEVHAAVLSIFQRSSSPTVLVSCLPAFDANKDWPLVRRRLEAALRAHPSDTEEWIGQEGLDNLIAVRRFGEEKARTIYRAYLKGGSAERYSTVAAALYNSKGEWDREFLVPMLKDKRKAVCNAAAEAIGQHHKK